MVKSKSVDVGLSKIAAAAVAAEAGKDEAKDEAKEKAKSGWKKLSTVVSTSSWLVGVGEKKQEEKKKITAKEKREQEYLDPFPWDPKVLSLLERWCPGLEPGFDPKKSAMAMLVERIYDLSKLLEKALLEKNDLYDQLDHQEAHFRELEGDRGSRMHDAITDMADVKASQRNAEQRFRNLEEQHAQVQLEMKSLERTLAIQRAYFDKYHVKSAPPLGEVTVVFLDVFGSKDLWAEVRPESDMVAAVAVFADTVRANIQQLGGYEVKFHNDAFMVVFDNPVDAVCFTGAVHLQCMARELPKSVASHRHCATSKDGNGKPLFRGFRIRVGLHTGAPKIVQQGKVIEAKSYRPENGPVDYVGNTVLRAAKIHSAAHGGQTLLSETTKLSLRQYDTAAVRHLFIEDIGDYHLKDLKVPEHLYSMVPLELRHRYFPPPQCDLPNTKAAEGALEAVNALAANYRSALDQAKAMHETALATTRALSIRLQHGISDYTIEPRVLLKNAYSEMDAVIDLAEKTAKKIAEEDGKRIEFEDRLLAIEKMFKRLVPTIQAVPKLKSLLEQNEKGQKGLVEATRLDKEANLKEVQEILSVIDHFRTQAETSKVLLRELKHWWRREQLDINPKVTPAQKSTLPHSTL